MKIECYIIRPIEGAAQFILSKNRLSSKEVHTSCNELKVVRNIVDLLQDCSFLWQANGAVPPGNVGS